MSERDALRTMLAQLATVLGEDLRHSVVVIGGMAPALYAGPDRAGVRATKDVDVVVDAATYPAWRRALERFEERGFRYHAGDPVCRFRRDGLTLDILPSEPTAIGLPESQWFSHVHASRLHSDAVDLHVVDPLVLLGLKIEAHDDRATGLIGGDKDLEDIVVVLANVDGLIEAIRAGRAPIHAFLRERLARLFDGDAGRERIETCLPGDDATQRFAAEMHRRLASSLGAASKADPIG